MVTIFSIPRDFKDADTARRQRNAVKSWVALTPRPEVILFGNDAGIAECCAEFHARHVPDVRKNEYGTPYLDSVFKMAQSMASHKLVCFVNADIILTNGFMSTIARAVQWGPRFCLLGQRVNIDLPRDIDTTEPDWAKVILAICSEKGKVQPPQGSDFFVFPKSIPVEMPPFVVGRPVWDNWMIYYFRKIRVPVVDISRSYMPVHQNHGYSHVLNRHENVKGHGASGPEGDDNIALLGYTDSIRFFLEECTHVLEYGHVYVKEETCDFPRRDAAFKVLHPTTYQLQNMLFNISQRCGIERSWVAPLGLFLSIIVVLVVCRFVWGQGELGFPLAILMALSLAVHLRTYYRIRARMHRDQNWDQWKLGLMHRDIENIAKKISGMDASLSDLKKKNEEICR